MNHVTIGTVVRATRSAQGLTAGNEYEVTDMVVRPCPTGGTYRLHRVRDAEQICWWVANLHMVAAAKSFNACATMEQPDDQPTNQR